MTYFKGWQIWHRTCALLEQRLEFRWDTLGYQGWRRTVIFRQLIRISPATQQIQPAQCLPLMVDTDTCSAEGARNVAAENENLLWCHRRCWALTYAIKPGHNLYLPRRNTRNASVKCWSHTNRGMVDHLWWKTLLTLKYWHALKQRAVKKQKVCSQGLISALGRQGDLSITPTTISLIKDKRWNAPCFF